jgi:hypothetical protein
MAKNKKPRGWGKARVKLSGGGLLDNSDPRFPVVELDIFKNMSREDKIKAIESGTISIEDAKSVLGEGVKDLVRGKMEKIK